MKNIIIVCLFFCIGRAKAQEDTVFWNRNMLDAEVLQRSSNTEIDTVHSLSNNRSNVLMYEVVFKNKKGIEI